MSMTSEEDPYGFLCTKIVFQGRLRLREHYQLARTDKINRVASWVAQLTCFQSYIVGIHTSCRKRDYTAVYMASWPTMAPTRGRTPTLG